MKHLFIPYELALKLKKKGFDEPCFYAWCVTPKHRIQYEGEICLRTDGNPFGSFNSGKNWNNITGKNSNKIKCSAPLYQQVIDWLFGITSTVIVYNPADIESVNKEIVQWLDKLESTK